MPIYEFRCLKCGCEFERITLKPLGDKKFDCPKCNSSEVEKLNRLQDRSEPVAMEQAIAVAEVAAELRHQNPNSPEVEETEAP